MASTKTTNAEKSEGLAEKNIAKHHEHATFTLNEDGMILDCSESCARIFEYLRHDLVGQHISQLFPQFAKIALMQNSRINRRLAFLCHCGHRFEAQGRNGKAIPSELSFIQLNRVEKGTLRMIVRPSSYSDAQKYW